MTTQKEAQTNVHHRLLAVQHELKAPRQAGGRFGKARSAEQILEAAKPVCYSHGLLLVTSDLVHAVGTRTYVTATAKVINIDEPEQTVKADANAWEGDISRGLDAPQVTGSASSYAKKYALQNLFAIDDTSDADFHQEDEQPAMGHQTSESATDVLARAKKQINETLEAQGYNTVTAKMTFINAVLQHSTIDNLNEADLVMDQLENEASND